MKITIATDCLARYPEGGGLWSWFLQYPLGLAALGHEIVCLELLRGGADAVRDQRLVRLYFERMKQYGLAGQCALIRMPASPSIIALDECECFGRSAGSIRRIASESEVLWNIAGALQNPLLGMFPWRAFIDVDPGHLHVSALTCDFALDAHHRYLTVGCKIGDADCEAPTLGLNWQSFAPFVFLPLCMASPDPGPGAPFTTVTQWNWEELWWNGRRLSISKREAYLNYHSLPLLAGRPFELAANLDPDDSTGDRQLLKDHQWHLVHPHEVAGSPEDYQEYIRRSRAEICCPKPIFRELRTGWLSDRSVQYLASGRPVLAEDTGFSDRFPCGDGLLAFRNIEEALTGVAEIDAHYAAHSRAARELAEAFFDSNRCLTRMLAACQ